MRPDSVLLLLAASQTVLKFCSRIESSRCDSPSFFHAPSGSLFLLTPSYSQRNQRARESALGIFENLFFLFRLRTINGVGVHSGAELGGGSESGSRSAP